MEHVWVRAETRPNEARSPLTPEGAARLIAAGFRVTVEESAERALPISLYRASGAEIAAEGAWRGAPADAWILGLKELPDDGAPLRHRHIMFGHAYKRQAGARTLLDRFAAGGGTLFDLEYLVDDDGRRVAAFGRWAGFAGAAVALLAWAAAKRGTAIPEARIHPSPEALAAAVRAALAGDAPRVLVVGALGRTGRGAVELIEAVGVAPARWDLDETRHGGPFPEILEHDVFLNCILAGPGAPVFVGPDDVARDRRLGTIGDIACDPGSPVSAVPIYERATTWAKPVVRVAEDPPLDVMAIDNLPAMLPVASSEDFAAQLLPHLLSLPDGAPWRRAAQTFRTHLETA